MNIRKWAYCLVLCLVACSCRTKYVPVESVRTDSIYINKSQRDSIYLRDSIFVREKGDTVLVEKYKYLYIDKLLRDTAYIERRDSIPYPVEVEKELSRWQRQKMNLGGAAILVSFILLIALIIVIWIKKKGGGK